MIPGPLVCVGLLGGGEGDLDESLESEGGAFLFPFSAAVALPLPQPQPLGFEDLGAMRDLVLSDLGRLRFRDSRLGFIKI